MHGRSGAGELSRIEPRDRGDSVARRGDAGGGAAVASACANARRSTRRISNGQDFIGFDEDLSIRRELDRFFRAQGIEVNW